MGWDNWLVPEQLAGTETVCLTGQLGGAGAGKQGKVLYFSLSLPEERQETMTWCGVAGSWVS